MSQTQVKIQPDNHLMVGLLGQRDELLRLIESSFDAKPFVRGNEITVEGPDATRVGELINQLVLLLEDGHALDSTNVGRAIDMVKADEKPSDVLTAEVLRSAAGRTVRPKTSGQKRYVDAIAGNVITFGIGPAGTGKSYLAVALGVQSLQAKQFNRIILTRPAVEAGERLGFLPGDLMAKVDPYLRPLYDALFDMLEPEGAQRLLERGTIEVAPLAFMRGRTLNDSFIILDEAQNTTPEQMKMFLTRIGFNSKVVVTGDVTQIDLAGARSGLLGLDRRARGHRRSRVRASHRARRRAPQDRAGHRPCLRAHLRCDALRAHLRCDALRAHFRRDQERSTSALMAVEVFAADEQHEASRRRRALGAPGRAGAAKPKACAGDTELSMLFVDEVSMADLNKRFRGQEGATDVLAFPIDEDLIESGRSPDSGGPGPGVTPPEPPEPPQHPGRRRRLPSCRTAQRPSPCGHVRRRARPARRARHPPSPGHGPRRRRRGGRHGAARASCSSGSTLS